MFALFALFARLALSSLSSMLALSSLSCVSALSAVNSGYNRLKNPYISTGLSNYYSDTELDEYGVRGLVPKGDVSRNIQLDRLMNIVNSRESDIDKYLFLQSIQDTSEYLYFSLIARNIKALMPIIYTPTVGQACIMWSDLFREVPRGLYISANDIGHVRECFDNWPNKNVKVIVITDGERILGLGDLGSNGMPIPIGKLALYTACAGIPPDMCLPIQVDVGCNNENTLYDPNYIGLRKLRPAHNDASYFTLIDEIIETAKDKYGDTVLIQFEDFGNRNAFKLIERWGARATCFNDDIQGTASVVLGGILASSRKDCGLPIEQHTFLFFGAGEAGCGIADLIAEYIKFKTGCSPENARKNIWLFDSKGIVCSDRTDLSHYKLPYAHSYVGYGRGDLGSRDLTEAINNIKPTTLIGVSGQANSFTKPVIRSFTESFYLKYSQEKKPIIMALSNPTNKAECSASSAYEWSNNTAIFISGSPFNPVYCSDRKIRIPGQGNNAYVFPGIGLGAIMCGASIIEPDDMIVAAETLANMVPWSFISAGSCYPSISNIRNVSINIAEAICENQWNKNTSTIPRPPGKNLRDWIKNFMYEV